MDPSLVLQKPPPLDPAWLLYESQQPPTPTSPPDMLNHRKNYAISCDALNTKALLSTHSDLSMGLTITGSSIAVSNTTHSLHYRTYQPTTKTTTEAQNPVPAVIYYHGGGLYVGSLSIEDLSCRLISKTLNCVVYSCTYRLLPEHTPDDSLSDAIAIFWYLVQEKPGPFIIIGSSSGGQLAAQVSLDWVKQQQQRHTPPTEAEKNPNKKVIGVLLRSPVTCNAYSLLPSFLTSHTSLSPLFYNSLISGTCVDDDHRTTTKLPLEEYDNDEFVSKLPKQWIQVCTNDVFYSDGACYGEMLRLKGVDVRLDVVVGWPHTFWLKVPELEKSREVDEDMLGGLRWLVGGVKCSVEST